MMPKETAVTKMRLKSVIARHHQRQTHKVTGYVLNGGTPIRSVEVRPTTVRGRKRRSIPETTGTYSWKLFHYEVDRCRTW